MDEDARRIIEKLELAPHPEGGWYRETWRGPAGIGGRPTATTIYFLLEAHQRSHWHKVDADEFWFWHAGGRLALLTAPSDEGPVTRRILGPDVAAGDFPQALVNMGGWQATEPLEGWGLVSCVVSPAFQFEGFTLAPPDWSPGSRS